MIKPKRVYIIHGWDDRPYNGWFPWLKRKLETNGAEVHVPAMPDAAHPAIDVWVPFLQRLVGTVDADTYFVGHSIGCQTILRYLTTVPDDIIVGGVVLVAGWVTLKPEALEDEDSVVVARPWLDRAMNWPTIRKHLTSTTVIMSDDDPVVPLDNGKVFARELAATVIVERQKKHLGGSDGVSSLPSVLKALEGMMD